MCYLLISAKLCNIYIYIVISIILQLLLLHVNGSDVRFFSSVCYLCKEIKITINMIIVEYGKLTLGPHARCAKLL